MSDAVYTSRSTIRRIKGPVRLATIPAEPNPITFGVHGEIAEHYGVDPNKFPPHATTIDYLIAATGA